MTALLPGAKIAGALPAGKAGGAIVSGGATMLAKRSGAVSVRGKGGVVNATAGSGTGAKNVVSGGKLSKEPIWSSGTTSGGEYLSVADRKAIFRKQKINAAKFVGRSTGSGLQVSGISKIGSLVKGSGSSLVPLSESDKAEQEAGSIVSSKPKEKKVGSKDGILNLKKQVENNSKKITLLKNIVKSHIKRFADFLVNDAQKEKDKLLAEQKKQLQDSESADKDKKEGFLESVRKNVSNSLLKPVKMVGAKVQGVLQQLMDTFTLLFAGWMSNKGIKAIQAWMSGDKDKLNEIKNNVLGALGVVGGIFLLLNGGLLALPALIGSIIGVLATVGGAILGFLLSPPGLITLAIAAGVGTLLLGVKKLWNWVDDKATGGDQIKAKHKELDQRLKDAGISMTGKDMGSKNKRGRSTKSLTEEQKKIFEEVEAGRAKLHELKNQMNAEIENVPNEVPESGTKTTGKGRNKKTITFHTEDDKKLIKQKQDDIRARYNALADGVVGGKPKTQISTGSASSEKITTKNNSSAISTKTNTTNVTSSANGLGPTKKAPPNVIMKTQPAGGNQNQAASSSTPGTTIPKIASSNVDNFYTMYSQMHYNVVI